MDLLFKLCITFEEFPKTDVKPDKVEEVQSGVIYEQFPPKREAKAKKPQKPRMRTYEDEKDNDIKSKISTLVLQTMHDCQRKMKAIESIKEEHREQPPYKAGFILSMVKKSKQVLDELFNVAIRHREQWQAIEQLKIFELIVHTNVDTTNLLRQLVDVHVKHMNGTQTRKRVILL
ncbi:unnamed protein product [Chrysodeixis includens]|uniref:Uncharacterized protein n=1 Tax=Chrysodeixis includens TaxID=689277 RepID=A0A9N8KXE9_CHRIL|nr:unnamed protein product [Chrysodeixis includens]